MQLDIQNALNDRLKSYVSSSGDVVAWEGMNFTPKAGIPHLKAFNLPGRADVRGLGPDGMTQTPGVYQIDCVFPMGQGHGPAKAKADAIAAWFPRGLQLIAEHPNLRVKLATVGPGIPDGGWYTVPVTVLWIAYL